MFKISEEVKVLICKVISVLCIIGTLAIIILDILQPEEVKVEETTSMDYVQETVDAGNDLTNQIYALIASGELDGYYTEEELEWLTEAGIR